VANEIDELMQRDPLELSSQDIDAIIAYQRKARAAHDSGVKPKRGSSVPLDLTALGLVKKEPAIRRRKL
jgi:hypothetical protein